MGVATPFVIVILLALLPHIGVILTSVSETGQWYQSVLPRVFTTAHYEHALTHELALPSIRNSLIFSGLSVVLDIAIGLALGILIVRSRLPFALKALIDSLSHAAAGGARPGAGVRLSRRQPADQSVVSGLEMAAECH